MAETEIMPNAYEHEDFESADASVVYGEGFTDEYPAPSAPSMSTTWLVSICLLMVGNVLLVLVNGELGPAILSVLFLIMGLIIHFLPGFQDPYARRAFVLSFCTYVFIAGLAQCYAYLVFDVLHTHIDALYFHDMTREGIGDNIFAAWPAAGVPSAIPIFLWRVLYTTVSPIGDGPWVGITLNCFIVAMAASITIKAGRYLFGDSPHRLRRLGTLFACCGMFWLFSCIFLRDSFALLINVIVLWACVKMLASPSFKNFIITATVIIISAVGMVYVRGGLWPLFVLFMILVFFSWTRRTTSSGVSFILPIALLFIGLLLLPVISAYSAKVASYVDIRAMRSGAGAFAGGSLGAALVVNQPMFIRIPVGAVYVLAYPVPLWSFFGLIWNEYHWMKGYHGIFFLLVVPGVFVGLSIAIKRALAGGIRAPAASFVVAYVIVTLMVDAATTLETRHYAQFMPGLLLLAALPDRSDPTTRRKIRLTAIGWFSFIGMGHIMWMAMKFF